MRAARSLRNEAPAICAFVAIGLSSSRLTVRGGEGSIAAASKCALARHPAIVRLTARKVGRDMRIA
jgi:hypothetical protein